jgi:hypothetical protein
MDLTAAERRWRSKLAKAMAARLRAEGKWTNGNPKYRPWSPEELALLDTKLTDAEVAARTGRSEVAVRVMRGKRKRTGRDKEKLGRSPREPERSNRFDG